jgi:hypothetical protein
LKSTEVAQPPQPSKTAQAPDVEEPKPQVPLSDVGEPKLPGAPSGHPQATAQTPSGGRAILAMEKGAPGDHAFAEIFREKK